MSVRQEARSTPDTAAARKAAAAGTVGTALEFYDFLIYGTASAVVFNKLFFPTAEPVVGVLLAFATFGAGFLTRPIGGVVLGHFGDRTGRKNMLVLTVTMTGLCTAAIGVLPTYASIGVLAPLLLVTLRLVQGFFLGGEQGGAVVLVVEHAPPGRRGWYGAWAFLGAPGGHLLSTGVFAAVVALSGDELLTWGWRVPFLLSLVLLVVGLYIRLRVAESPEFTEVRDQGRRARRPVAETLREHWRQVLRLVGINMGLNAFMSMLTVFVLSYGIQHVGVSRNVMLVATMVGTAMEIAAVLFFAKLSDRIGRAPVLRGGAVFLVAYAFPMFWLLDTGSPALIVVALVGGFVGASAVFGPLAAFCVERFTTTVRYTGVSLGYQTGAVLGGGLSPFVATALLDLAGGQAWSVSLYLAAGALLTFACVPRS
ncbi:MFS transporter [Actinosynnema sp. CS-041913]|uniref:MFS transporter n=1 Tax=Actinosynnema sp. CS-041913 TaxID=3239917 RepID=UPI003D94BD42